MTAEQRMTVRSRAAKLKDEIGNVTVALIELTQSAAQFRRDVEGRPLLSRDGGDCLVS